MLDENGVKPLNVLMDDPDFAKLNWFSLFRLKTPLEKFCSWNDLSLRSTGATLPSVQTGKTPVDHVSQSSTGVTFPSEKTGRTLRASATTDEYYCSTSQKELQTIDQRWKKGWEPL